MKKKGISLALVIATLTMTTSFGTQVKADPTLDSAKNQYSEALQKVEAVNEQVRKLDAEISALVDKQNSTEKSISDKQDEIAKKQEEVEKTKAELQKSEDDFKKRVRAVYKNGNDVVINVLVESKSMGDLLERTQTVKEVSKRERTIMETIKTEKVALEKAKSKVEEEVVTLNSLKDELQKQIDEVNKQKDDQKVALAEAESVKNKYATEVKAIEDQMAAEAARLQAARAQQATATIAQASNVAPSRGGQETTTATAAAVLAEAEKHLGKPYVWGAKGPNTFDCSGFVQYVFRQVGISAPAPTYTQETLGTYVAKGQEQPGDLVFFGQVGNTHHVGIYVGGGMYIHAPQTGDVVKYSYLSGSRDYSFSRRLLN